MANPLSQTALAPSKQFSTPEEQDAWLMNLITIAEKIKPGSPVLGMEANELLLDLYAKTLWEIGSPQRFFDAWAHVLQNKQFRPDVADIRRAAGLDDRTPQERQAHEDLTGIIQAMRNYQPAERATLGAKKGGISFESDGKTPKRDESGAVLVSPDTPAIEFQPRCEAAITLMGHGNRKSGLEAISAHPALGYSGLPEFRMKAAKEIEAQWISAWRNA